MTFALNTFDDILTLKLGDECWDHHNGIPEGLICEDVVNLIIAPNEMVDEMIAKVTACPTNKIVYCLRKEHNPDTHHDVILLGCRYITNPIRHMINTTLGEIVTTILTPPVTARVQKILDDQGSLRLRRPNGETFEVHESFCEPATPEDMQYFFPYTVAEISDSRTGEKYIAEKEQDCKTDMEMRLYLMACGFFRGSLSSGTTFVKVIA